MKLTVTKNSLEKKHKDLEKLKTRRKDLVIDKEEARSQGDLKENFGYQEAVKQIGIVDRQIAEATEFLNKNSFDTVDPLGWSKERKEKGALLGSEVSFLRGDPNLADTEMYIIGGALDDHEDVVPYTAPLGELLLGKKEGDKFKGEIAGRTVQIQVTKVTNPSVKKLKDIYATEKVIEIEPERGL
jgi:transcription elongation factor GreA